MERDPFLVTYTGNGTVEVAQASQSYEENMTSTTAEVREPRQVEETVSTDQTPVVLFGLGLAVAIAAAVKAQNS